MPDEPGAAGGAAPPGSQSNYYYVNGQRIPLSVEPGVVAVKFKPGLRSTSDALLSETKRVLLEGAENTNFLPTYGLQIYRTAGEALPVLSKDQSIEFATPAFRQGPQSPDLMFATNRFLAQFKPEVTPEQIAQLNERYHVHIVEPLGYVENGYLLAVDDQINAQNVIAIANAYYESGLAIFSNPDFIKQRHMREATVNPRATAAPAVNLSGTYLDQQWHLKLARVIDAWQIPGLSAPQGSPRITIGILDDGVATAHPEFSMNLADGNPKVAAQFDFSSHTTDGTPKHEQDNHGTACAGVATAGGVNAYGAAPGCRLMAVRTPDYLGVADEGKMFQWTADNGADIISCSWGPVDGVGAVEPLADSTRAAIHYCATKGRGGKGIPIFWAAGNGNEGLEVNGQPRDGYAANPEVMAIAASTSKDTKAWYSDFGQAVFICAPSSGNANINEASIFTVDRPAKDGYNTGDPNSGDANGNYYNRFGGTSSAAPLLAGIAALLLSANPGLTVQQVRTILQQTAHKVGSPGDYDTNGHSTIYGYGRVDAYAAVQSASRPAANAPSILGPASVPRNAGPPTFQINPAPNQYYIVEVTTRAELFDVTNHNAERTQDNFYGSWSDNAAHASAASYTLPAAVWQRLKMAEKLYYRIGSMTNATGWDNYLVSIYDNDWQMAPFIQISNVPVATATRGVNPMPDGATTVDKTVGTAAAVGRDAPTDAPAAASVNIHYDVQLIPQPNKLSCWAASMAMLVSYGQQASIDPESLAQAVDRSLRTSYGWDMLEEVKTHYGFQDIPLPSNASLYPPPEQWSKWLGTYGPLWVTTIGAPSHAIVVRGIQGDLTPEGTVIEILNPWNISTAFSDDPIDFDPANSGMAYAEAFKDFAAEFGNLGLDNYGNWRVLYLPGTTTVAPRDVGTAPVAKRDMIPVTVLPELMTSFISGPDQYSRNGPAPTFAITSEKNRFFAVEATTHWSLFDRALNEHQRTPQNFFGSWMQGLRKMEGEMATYTLPPVAWATLREAAQLYYRVLTTSADTADWPDYQTSTPDEQASSAPSIHLIGSAGKRLDTIFIRPDELLWRGNRG